MISKARLPIQGLAVLLGATTASAQENRGTPEQRAACAPVAFRFSLWLRSRPIRTEYCPRLSDACRPVFELSAGLLAGRSPKASGRPATDREAE